MLRKGLFLITLIITAVYNVIGLIHVGYSAKVLFHNNKQLRVDSLRKPLLLHGSVSEDMNWDPKAYPKLDFSEDYYSVLEVDVKASPKELKKAFYKLVTKYHPDNKTGEEAKRLANKQMMVINNAYKVLKELESRKQYDYSRSQGRVGYASKVRNSSTGANSNSRKNYSSKQDVPDEEPVESLEDILKDLFKDGNKNVGKKLFEDFLEYLENEVEQADAKNKDKDEYSKYSWEKSDFKTDKTSSYADVVINKKAIDEELAKLKKKMGL